MRRILLLLSALSLCLLAWGTTFHPDFAAFWLASGEITYQIVRLLLSMALLIQFCTNPPRNIYFRLLCGVIAAGSGLWAFEESFAYNMQYLDSLSILAASVSTGITALEINYQPEEHKTKNHVFVS